MESERKFKYGGQSSQETETHYYGEDASLISMHELPKIFAVAHNFALNLYQFNAFSSIAQAERFCKFGLDTLKTVFRMLSRLSSY
jgi:hypothetical protein